MQLCRKLQERIIPEETWLKILQKRHFSKESFLESLLKSVSARRVSIRVLVAESFKFSFSRVPGASVKVVLF